MEYPHSHIYMYMYIYISMYAYVISGQLITTSLPRHWNRGECSGNYPKMAEIQVGELLYFVG